MPPWEAPPRLALMFGNTLGSLDPIAAARDLAELLRPEDVLLVDGELYAAGSTISGYDNPINRAFAWAPLHAVGIRDEDGELVFEEAVDERVPGLRMIPKHLRAGQDVGVEMGGERLELGSGNGSK